MRYIALVFVSTGLVLAADPPQNLQASKTERLDFPAGGTLRMPKSIGELTIQGWDEPVIEITTIKSIKVRGDKPPGINPKELERIKVMPERKGNEFVITTAFPAFNPLVRPFTGLSNFELEYRIKVPRSAALEIDHRMGEIHIEGMTGDVHATDGMGQITVQLAPGNQYSIDGRSKLGAIDSDVPGQGNKRLKFGHTFMGQAAAGGKKLYLRVGFGDITIFDTPAPVYP